MMQIDPDKKKIKKKFYIESIILLLIALTPLYLKVYDYFPGPNNEAAHDSISILGVFTIGTNGFDSVSTNIWFYTQKMVPLLLFIFWFFTSKNWWYHIIIIPIAAYAFQLFELIYSEDSIIDTENIWWLLPVCMIVVPFVYLIRIKLYDKHVHGIDLEAMDAELNTLKNKTAKSRLKAIKKEEIVEEKQEQIDATQYLTISEYINTKLSTDNIERMFKSFQHNLKGWLHLKS